MCDSSTQSVIDSIVDNKVQSGELFTAFDVSLEVQSDLKSSGTFDSDIHRHRSIKNDVHKSIDRYLKNAQYNRKLCDVGAPTDAFVYFPQGFDPLTYVALSRNDTPVPDPFVIITAPAVASNTLAYPGVITSANVDKVIAIGSDGGSDDAGDGRKPDARGTVCVPNYLLRNAGFSPLDVVAVFSGKDDLGNDCLVIGKQVQVPSGVTPLTHYTVDSNCNVRITNSVFLTSGNVSKSYDFDGNSTFVFVKSK